MACYTEEKRILIVGLVCLDIINVLDDYPLEDTDSRVNDQLWERGGNAGNTSVVLSQLGVQTEFMGTLADNTLSQLMVEDFQQYGVHIDHCIYHKNCTPPASCIIINSSTGTRTILHNNRSLPELMYEDFELLNLKNYSWIHFEGRNIQEVLKMIDRVIMYNRELTESSERIHISVELEKPKLEVSIHKVLPKADVVFFSKDVAKAFGCQNGEECVLKFKNDAKPGAVIVCAWGELGAWAIGSDDEAVHSPAYPPAKIRDTVGAGDTFNAGVIYSISRGQSVLHAVTQGCKVAGEKIGHQGFRIGTDLAT
ncbi:ketohexokinase-like [Acanthaster planci]|uniref:Ketohexokinase n=1 Tax=Acanthaster planci TaxID=133434 RepID=A0A8B7ZF17_ACAPL|nr:ketohexokinase-like [Acanthaster planci]XP_022103579.1 ketohexokinase-like [Acanthaster planci]XP_022103580.1 ketohexokinase-like [Acanthaster planci]XP_022103581.1 ketohexokinase-like [Acanthaster planci]XP_022103582.1 ketohexokinase-like [Acanthaster planci]